VALILAHGVHIPPGSPSHGDLEKRDPRATIPDHAGPLLETIPPRIIGMSQWSIGSTFNNDTVEHGNLTRFFG
jgi:hypothetical protein